MFIKWLSKHHSFSSFHFDIVYFFNRFNASYSYVVITKVSSSMAGVMSKELLSATKKLTTFSTATVSSISLSHTDLVTSGLKVYLAEGFKNSSGVDIDPSETDTDITDRYTIDVS